jgi:hypothetical protein
VCVSVCVCVCERVRVCEFVCVCSYALYEQNECMNHRDCISSYTTRHIHLAAATSAGVTGSTTQHATAAPRSVTMLTLMGTTRKRTANGHMARVMCMAQTPRGTLEM